MIVAFGCALLWPAFCFEIYHAIACLFLLLARYKAFAVVGMYHSLSIYRSVGGHLDCFQL